MTKISEFRQAWINDLRQDIAAYLGSANAWRVLTEHPAHRLDIKGEAIEVSRKTADARIAARVLLWRIQMRFSPWSNKFKATDDQFLLSLEELINEAMWKRRDIDDWDRAADAAAYAGREILKREWEVTKTQPFRSRQTGTDRAT